VKTVASCNISIKRVTSSKVYLKGSVTGLDSSKTYCMLYRVVDWGEVDWTNLPSNSFGYTYFGSATSLSLDANGCYIPKSDLSGIDNVDIACYEVNGNCETRIGKECQKTLNVEEEDSVPTYVDIDFYVSDDQPLAMSGVRVVAGEKSDITGSDGKATISLQTGIQCTVIAETPSGYKPIYTSRTFTPTNPMTYPFKFERLQSGDGNGDYVPPSGANKQIVISLRPLSWANYDLIRSKLPDILGKVTSYLASLSSKYTVIGDVEMVGDDIIINIREE